MASVGRRWVSLRPLTLCIAIASKIPTYVTGTDRLEHLLLLNSYQSCSFLLSATIDRFADARSTC
jgi:hypothetical protein